MKARSEIIMTHIFLRRYSILSGNDDMIANWKVCVGLTFPLGEAKV